MKRLFVVAVFLLPVGSYASDATEDARIACGVKGDVFESAASLRDDGAPPQTALNVVSSYLNHPWPGIDRNFMVKAVNLVYFDPGFINAGGRRLKLQIEGDCLRNGKPQFQPLK